MTNNNEVFEFVFALKTNACKPSSAIVKAVEPMRDDGLCAPS